MQDYREKKKALRKELLGWRRGLAVSQWQDLSRQLCDRLVDHLTNYPQFSGTRTLLAYQSFRQEPDLAGVWGYGDWSNSKVWGMPRCVKENPSDSKPTRLCWHRWDPTLPLVSGAYGLQEPDATLPILEATQVDLMLVPMVAGDRQGYRLGYGGGFYDRLLSQPQWDHVVKVGVVFSNLLVDRLPHDQWDCQLDAICTEKQWLDISPGG